MQKQQQETMKQFLEGMKEIEESSRRFTAETLLGVAKIFADSRKDSGDKKGTGKSLRKVTEYKLFS